MILKLKDYGKKATAQSLANITSESETDIECPLCHELTIRSGKEYCCTYCWSLFTTDIKQTPTIKIIAEMIKDFAKVGHTVRVIIEEDGKYQPQFLVNTGWSGDGTAWFDTAANFSSDQINKAAELITCMAVWGSVKQNQT